MATEQQEHLKIEQLSHQSADDLDHIAGRERENLEGWIPTLATDAEISEALEKAFDYRGDVTLTLRSGEVVEGYIFDRTLGASLSQSYVRLLPAKGGQQKIKVAYADIASLAFTGRDTAAGRSFDAWVKKYWEKKAAGEKNIGIEAEKLD